MGFDDMPKKGRTCQEQAFSVSEGDNWFKRNNPPSFSEVGKRRKDDRLCNTYAQLGLKPKLALEIGCSTGWRLEALRREYGCICKGIDPSRKAVDEGRNEFPDIELHVGTADDLSFADATFDLVTFGFCLYLCSPKQLFCIASEADRVLADGGHVAILDFFPPQPYRNSYRDCEGLYSYKMAYRDMFLWNPQYIEISHRMYAHHDQCSSTAPDERVAVDVLRKCTCNAYPSNPFRDQE